MTSAWFNVPFRKEISFSIHFIVNELSRSSISKNIKAVHIICMSLMKAGVMTWNVYDSVMNALDRERANKQIKACTDWLKSPVIFHVEAKQAITSENAAALKNHLRCLLIDHLATWRSQHKEVSTCFVFIRLVWWQGTLICCCSLINANKLECVAVIAPYYRVLV